MGKICQTCKLSDCCLYLEHWNRLCLLLAPALGDTAMNLGKKYSGVYSASTSGRKNIFRIIRNRKERMDWQYMWSSSGWDGHKAVISLRKWTAGSVLDLHLRLPKSIVSGVTDILYCFLVFSKSVIFWLQKKLNDTGSQLMYAFI